MLTSIITLKVCTHSKSSIKSMMERSALVCRKVSAQFEELSFTTTKADHRGILFTKTSAQDKEKTMAVGEFARPIYDLIEEIGNSPVETEKVFHELVRWMSGDDVRKFVDKLRREWELSSDSDEPDQSVQEWRGLTVYK